MDHQDVSLGKRIVGVIPMYSAPGDLSRSNVIFLDW